LDLHDFKRQLLKVQRRRGGRSSYSPIDFLRGTCLKEIPAGLFKKLRKRLDEAGALPVVGKTAPIRTTGRTVRPTSWDELADEEPSPARQATVTVTGPVRDPRIRLAAKKRANWNCEVPKCRIPKFEQRDTGRTYVEAHHLVPLGKRGVEHLSNIAVVCAWHHALLTHGPKEDAERIADQLRDVRRAER